MLLLFIVILRFLVVTSSEIEPKVVLGEKTNIQNHPYLAFLIIFQSTSAAHVCGASIVNQRVLLTAGHCFEGLSPKTNISAKVGHTNRLEGHLLGVTRVKVHPQYDTMTITNDIALAGLKEEIKFGKIVNRVALAQHRPCEGPALIAGWGIVSEDPYADTDFLHETKQMIWPKINCLIFLSELPEGTFCSGRVRDGGYPSKGDSGSPLMIDGYLQIGLVSFKNMEISTYIIVYTDIPYHYDWIARNVLAVSCE